MQLDISTELSRRFVEVAFATSRSLSRQERSKWPREPKPRPVAQGDVKVPGPPAPAPRSSSSLYLPEAVYEALREAAFKERRRIHDLVMEGIGLALRRRGYPPIEGLKAKPERKGR